jgi:hypothetical protein
MRGLIIAFLVLLPGCAQYHCSHLEESATCHAAYQAWRSCQSENKYKIRPAGLLTKMTCERRGPRCDSNGRCDPPKETCVPDFFTLYDYREYNLAVSACMSQRKFSAWDDYFNR